MIGGVTRRIPIWCPPLPCKRALKTTAQLITTFINRDFKIQRRGRQQERKKNNWFNKQNNNFARASRFFVHFFPVFARLRRENA